MNDKMESLIHDNLIRNYSKYYRLAFSYVHNEADAMDIVQEGACKAILNSGSLKNSEFADTWIYRIMINEALGFIKKNKKEMEPFEDIQASTTDIYEDIDLKEAVNQLEAVDKAIIVLRFFEDLKLEQIAEIVNENLSTVKSRLYRTLKKLRLSLDREGAGNHEA